MFKKLFTFLKGRKKKSIIFSVFFISLVAMFFIGMPRIADASWYDCLTEKILSSILMGIASILRLTYDFAVLTGKLLVYVIDNIVGLNITGNQTYYTTWASVRDIANMGIVLGFVFVGIATTLRIQAYAIKQIMPKLIVVAILINFTPLFVGLVIDSSNIIAKGLKGDPRDGIMKTLDDENGKLDNQKSFINYFINQVDNAGWSCDPILNGGAAEWVNTSGATGWSREDGAYAYLKNSFIDAIYFAFSGFIFLVFAGVLVIRYAMLIMLFILSPLAFFCIIFPFSSPQFKKWLDQFLKWSFVGVTVMFFVWLANKVFVASIAGPPARAATLTDIAIVCIFLYVGLKIAMKTSGAAGAMAMAAGVAVGGFAMGAVKTVGGKTLKAGAGVGGALVRKLPGADTVSNAYSKVSSAGGNFLESVGLRKVGVTAQKRARGANEAQKLMKDSTDAEIKQAMERRGATSAVVAGGAKELASRGSLGVVDSKKLPKLVKIATSHGVDRKVFEKANPNLTRGGHDKVKDTVRGLSGKEVKNMGNEALTPAVVASLGRDQMKSLTNRQKDYVRDTYTNAPKGSSGRVALAKHARMLKNTNRTEDFTNLMNNIKVTSGAGKRAPTPPMQPPVQPSQPRRSSSVGYSPVKPTGAGTEKVARRASIPKEGSKEAEENKKYRETMRSINNQKRNQI